MLDNVRKEALLNLKTARGQLDGVMKMIEEDRYCVDVSKQILAIGSLLKKANMAVVQGHVKTCVRQAVIEGEGEEKIEEIFTIIDRYAKG